MNLRDLGHRRIANAHAALRAKRTGALHDPAPESDAGRVLAVLRRSNTGLPNWAIARNAKMPATAVRYACQYLNKIGLAFAHRTEYLCQKAGKDRVMACWFPVAKPRRSGVADTTFCRTAMGYGRTCGTRLEEHMDALGRVEWLCPLCERRRRGICRTCPRKIAREAVDGPAPWFCAPCLVARRKALDARRIRTPEYKARKAELERQRIARCKADGIPYRSDRKVAA